MRENFSMIVVTVQAAIFWAEVRNQGKPTSDNKSDVLIPILYEVALYSPTG
jgi:hypothetical protein